MRASRSSSGTTGTALPRAFNVFWLGQSLSAIGDAMTVVAMPLVVFAATNSVAHMGRLTALARVGALIATAGAGFIVDRWDARRLMIGCDVFRWLLMALIPLAAAGDVRQIWLVYAVGICAALVQGLFYVGHVSLVAGLVGRARVGLANSRLEGTIALAYVFGPLLAGVLSAHFGPVTALGIDSATFMASALSLYAMGSSLPAAAAPELPRAGERSSPGWVGLRFLRNEPVLWRLTILVAVCQFFTAALVDLLIFRTKHDLGQGDTGTGLMFGLASAAGVLAALSTPWLRARFAFQRVWLSALLVQGVALLATCASHSFATVAAGAALFMAAMTTLLICQASLRQELTPQHLLGRVTSSYLTLIALPTPLGALVATALAARFGASPVQAGVGIGLLLTAAVAAAVWARMPRAAAS